jgi:hypothetical protein
VTAPQPLTGDDAAARREAAIQAMINKGHTRERAEAVFGIINRALFAPGGRFAKDSAERALPLHRTEAGWPRCSTCDGGGCPDCTDPA